LTQEEHLAKLLACTVYALGGSITISRELLDKMLPVRLLLDTETDEQTLTVSVLSNEILLGSGHTEKSVVG
jgi:hypothetical protein